MVQAGMKSCRVLRIFSGAVRDHISALLLASCTGRMRNLSHLLSSYSPNLQCIPQSQGSTQCNGRSLCPPWSLFISHVNIEVTGVEVRASTLPVFDHLQYYSMI